MAAAGAKSYPRSYRIASLMRRGLSTILRESHVAVTIRRISLSRDYGVATVHYSLLTGDVESAHAALLHDAALLRKRLATKINMRATPKLVFMLDHEGMAADNMQVLLDSFAPMEERE